MGDDDEDDHKGDRRREILRKGGCRNEGHGRAKRDEADRKPERPARRHMPLRPFPRRERHEELVECDAARHICRSEEHTSELKSLMRISYAVFCLKKKKNKSREPIQHKPTLKKKN